MRRRLARELALQSMYQMQMTSVSSKEAVTMVVEEAITDNEANLSVKKGCNITGIYSAAGGRHAKQ